MLTKSDIAIMEKVVKKVVRAEIEAEGRNIRDELRSDIIESRVRIQQEIRDLADRVKNLEVRVNTAEKNNKKEFQKLNKKLIKLFDFLDRDQIKVTKRVEKIEQNLKLSTLS